MKGEVKDEEKGDKENFSNTEGYISDTTENFDGDYRGGVNSYNERCGGGFLLNNNLPRYNQA